MDEPDEVDKQLSRLDVGRAFGILDKLFSAPAGTPRSELRGKAAYYADVKNVMNGARAAATFTEGEGSRLHDALANAAGDLLLWKQQQD